ncbi:MAG: hypothetical protein EZS28_005797 [Streblomastix strix]|uniref:Uncharacterized protein n=1 Tax=Streblomastix strix TaxID=222440 RepID=A0A5J4WUT0_9EUKA|nr:MAG: hypothetical protein EZS28_005797 [Streblomastix strix]
MDLQHALKNLKENGTNIEYFDNGYVIQINKDIKVFEEGKKTHRKLTQTQQNMLLLLARGGGLESKKKTQYDFLKQQEVQLLNEYKQKTKEIVDFDIELKQKQVQHLYALLDHTRDSIRIAEAYLNKK